MLFIFCLGSRFFGSTVLIPQMLQSLYGYTATDAGLVLGPGALVIVVMAPLVVRLVRQVPVSRLISFGFVVLGLAMWYYASFDLATDYRKEALARAVQGFGLAFLFVPTSQLAYSYLPKNKNNKASSLTNLFRNWGGSFGIAFVTTMLERRSQFHRSVLVSHLGNENLRLRAMLTNLTARFVERGYSPVDSATRATAQLNAIVQRQASLFGFLDCFWLLGVIVVAGPLLALFIRKFKQGGGGAAH